MKDYSGLKVKHLTYVRPTENIRNRHIVWEAICVCGKTVYTVPSKKQSCGCRIPQRKDWTGKKYYSMTFITPTGKRKDRSVVWKVRCDCGNVRHVKASDVIGGDVKHCGCRHDKVLEDLSFRKYTPIVSSARAIWCRRYKDGDVDFDTFYRLSQQNCSYCGRAPSTYNNVYRKNVGSKYQKDNGVFSYNGLDRVDNTRGHTLDNVVPCCANCNWMKSTSTKDEFISQVERIYEHTRRLRTP